MVEAGPGKVFEVLEDIVPANLLNEALSRFALVVGDPYQSVFDGSGAGNTAKRIEKFCREHLPSTKDFTDIEIRSGVTDVLVDMLSEEQSLLPSEAELRVNVVAICAKLNAMIAHAKRNAAQRSLKYLIGLQVDSFFKWHSESASKGELKQLLENINQAAFGKGQDHKMTRSNCEDLIEFLDKETKNSTDKIDLLRWIERLKAFAVQPWGGKPKQSKGAPKPAAQGAESGVSSVTVN